MANALGHVSRCCLNKKHRMPGGFVSFGKYNAYAFFSLCIFFPAVQLSGFMFMEAREENCTFAVEHVFVIGPPLPSNMTASPSPPTSFSECICTCGCYLLSPSTSFPAEFCVTLCTSEVSGIHWQWCHLECDYLETLWELNFINRTAGRCLHSADVGLYLGAVWAWSETVSVLHHQKLCGWCAAGPTARGSSCKRSRHSAVTFGAAGYGQSVAEPRA